MSPSTPIYEVYNSIVFIGFASISYGSDNAMPVHLLPISSPKSLADVSIYLICLRRDLISL